jgi:hypothetical protein
LSNEFACVGCEAERFRSEQLFPDEPVTITVLAGGFQPQFVMLK